MKLTFATFNSFTDKYFQRFFSINKPFSSQQLSQQTLVRHRINGRDSDERKFMR